MIGGFPFDAGNPFIVSDNEALPTRFAVTLPQNLMRPEGLGFYWSISVKLTNPLLYSLMAKIGLVPQEEQATAAPEWSIPPQGDISYLALRVGVPGLNEPLKDHYQPHEDATGTHVEQTPAVTRFKRLMAAHAEAVLEIERIRQQHGQLTTGVNGHVGNSILEAGARALMDCNDDDQSEPKQFVVAAPPGTGKTSHAIALMAAVVRTADQSDLSKPFGCLFVVDQIKKADDMFRQINELMPGQVAVWTSDHDVNSIAVTQVFVPHNRRFHVDQLEKHPIAVVTQAFLRGPRGDKARYVVRGDDNVARALTIFDEQTKEVEVYDIKQSTAIKVKETLEREVRFGDVKSKMEPLLAFLQQQSKQTGNSIETPNDDPEGWRIARGLLWFASEDAEQFALKNARDIEHLDEVFGFAAQMYRNYAFIFRFGGGENGSNFMGYVPAPAPTGNSLLLDATADIDGVNELCHWRTQVSVPQVRYDHLHIVHAEDYTRKNLTEFFQKETNRRRYVEHAKKIIRDVMAPGKRGLIVCKKRLVGDGLFPQEATKPEVFDSTNGETKEPNRFPWNFEDRYLAVTWWGGHGVGANDWKEADFVFQFGEHILPTRTMYATVQGLQGHKATMGMLWKNKSTNSRPAEVSLATEGHLLRFMKQMGMRGRARSFDKQGVCGKQVLVLTCDFERLLVNADKLFPGASLSKWGRTPKHFKDLTQPEKLMEILTDPEALGIIEGQDIAKRLGSTKWSAVSTNALTPKIRDRVVSNLGWAYETKRGPGGGSRFVKTGTAVLRPKAYNRPEDMGV